MFQECEALGDCGLQLARRALVNQRQRKGCHVNHCSRVNVCRQEFYTVEAEVF
jgi:hypothetical protein